MTQEEFGKEWEEIKNLRLIGPTIEEYLKRLEYEIYGK